MAAGDPNYSLKDIIYYGWPIFAAVARAMLAILHFFYGIVGNYGIAIIMLTVLVRGALFPISFKQTQNMARMQALKPEMDRINEKYKTDMQKRSQAMQELYRKHKINPLGGCLPRVSAVADFHRAVSFADGRRRAAAIAAVRRQRFAGARTWPRRTCFGTGRAFMPDCVNSGQGIFGWARISISCRW